MVLSFLWSPILTCRSQVKKKTNDPFSPFSWSWDKLMVNRLTSGFIGYCNGHSSSTVIAGLALSSCFQLSLILLPPIYRCRILSLVRKQNPLLKAWEPLTLLSFTSRARESRADRNIWTLLGLISCMSLDSIRTHVMLFDSERQTLSYFPIGIK